MAFSYETFLKPLSPGDRVLQIFNSEDVLLYSINPFSITNTQVHNNLIRINLKSARVITLDFQDSTIAKSALPLLQSQIEVLKNKKPFLIDKQVENYVEDKIQGLTSGGTGSGDQGPQGFTGPIGDQGPQGNTGAQGNAGPQGNTGAQGFVGPTGALGESAVEVGPTDGVVGFIPRWITGKTLSNTGSIYDDGSKVYIGTATGSYLLNVGGTISLSDVVIAGDILPSRDYTDPLGGFDLGSTTSRWENIYVKDALVASQSIYIGDVKLSGATEHLIVNGRGVNKYEGTSSTFYQIGNVGEIVTFDVVKDLSYVKGDSIKIQNTFQNFYEEPGYSIESNYFFFIGKVDDYLRDQGLLNVIITYSDYVGSTSSIWFFKLNSDLLGFETTIEQRLDGAKLYGSSSTTMSIPDVGDIRQFYTQTKLGFNAGQTVIVYNTLPNNYEDDEYVEGNGQYFIGRVDYYYPNTGQITVVADYIGGSGTYSYWELTISSNPLTESTPLGVTASFDELTMNGTMYLQQVVEDLNTSTQSSDITYDFSKGGIWYHDDLTIDYNATFINVPTWSNFAITTNIIISQSSTAYLPTTVTINGVTQSVKWSGGTPPTGNVNQTDIVGFSFINYNGSFVQVLGQLGSFA
jgi:hypothetical protein